jgi:glyoxylase-like metal-dependent hydrolase (beta-lactamase superfamily II)
LPSSCTGLIKDNFYTCGLPWSATYLLDAPRPVLFESGFCCAGPLYEEDIRRILGVRQPELLFLTHVHWDHCGSAGYLKQAFPSLEVAASERGAQIMERPNAVDLMMRLSADVLPLVEAFPGIDHAGLYRGPFTPFHVDVCLKDGQTIDLGDGLTVEVLATPGHTRDHLSYYIPEKRILIATEASGCLDRAGNLITEFLVDFDAYLSSLKRLAGLRVDVLVQGHHFIHTGAEVAPFFARSIMEAQRYRDYVCALLDARDGIVEDVVQQIKAEQWDTNPGIKQPEEPYLINVRTQVTHFAGKRANR